MTLAQQMAAEVAVFFNPQEFSQPLTVDGIPVLGLWEDREDEAAGVPNAWGINAVTRLLYLPQDFSTFMAQQDITVDGTVWTVRDLAELSGVVRLTLVRNEA